MLFRPIGIVGFADTLDAARKIAEEGVIPGQAGI